MTAKRKPTCDFCGKIKEGDYGGGLYTQDSGFRYCGGQSCYKSIHAIPLTAKPKRRKGVTYIIDPDNLQLYPLTTQRPPPPSVVFLVITHGPHHRSRGNVWILSWARAFRPKYEILPHWTAKIIKGGKRKAKLISAVAQSHGIDTVWYDKRPAASK